MAISMHKVGGVVCITKNGTHRNGTTRISARRRRRRSSVTTNSGYECNMHTICGVGLCGSLLYFALKQQQQYSTCTVSYYHKITFGKYLPFINTVAGSFFGGHHRNS